MTRVNSTFFFGDHTEDVAEVTLPEEDIKVVALADLFEDRLTDCARSSSPVLGIRVPVTMATSVLIRRLQSLATP